MGDRPGKRNRSTVSGSHGQKTQVREPEYSQNAMSRDTNDIGYTYVEMDLPNHRLVVYQNGTPAADTGIISSSATPEGVYKIQEMHTPPK